MGRKNGPKGMATRKGVTELLDCVEEIDARHGVFRSTTPPVPKLWVRSAGNRELVLGGPRIAIVGTRACTDYGRMVAVRWGRELAAKGVTIVSGGAIGIDAAAHAGSLEYEMRAVCVLACDIHQKGVVNGRLVELIIEQGGCLVSQFEPPRPAAPAQFLQRNRVIAGLSDAVIVVEGSDQSGTSSTARHAQQLGVPLLAVPGPITTRYSWLPNQLIRAGKAVPVTSVLDVLETVYPKG